MFSRTKHTGQGQSHATDEEVEQTMSDCRVLVTATCSFIRAYRSRQILRLQRHASSDPNVHRAINTAHQECGWKQGVQAGRSDLVVACADAPDRCDIPFRARSGPLQLKTVLALFAVNGLDRGGLLMEATRLIFQLCDFR